MAEDNDHNKQVIQPMNDHDDNHHHRGQKKKKKKKKRKHQYQDEHQEIDQYRPSSPALSDSSIDTVYSATDVISQQQQQQDERHHHQSKHKKRSEHADIENKENQSDATRYNQPDDPTNAENNNHTVSSILASVPFLPILDPVPSPGLDDADDNSDDGNDDDKNDEDSAAKKIKAARYQHRVLKRRQRLQQKEISAAVDKIIQQQQQQQQQTPHIQSEVDMEAKYASDNDEERTVSDIVMIQERATTSSKKKSKKKKKKKEMKQKNDRKEKRTKKDKNKKKKKRKHHDDTYSNDEEDKYTQEEQQQLSSSSSSSAIVMKSISNSKRILDPSQARHGRFTNTEKKILMDRIAQYCHDHQVPNNEETMNKILASNKYREFRGCWLEIGSCLPGRSADRINDFARYYFAKLHRGKYSSDEISTLLSLIAIYGKKWTTIGKILNRYRLSIRDKYRSIKADYKRGKWNDEEDKQLIALVQQCHQSFGTNDHSYIVNGLPMKHIFWTTISSIINRTHSQCRHRYYHTLLPKILSHGLFTLADQHIILQNIFIQQCTDESEIQYDTLHPNYPSTVCQIQWKRLIRSYKNQYGDHNDYHTMIDRMNEQMQQEQQQIQQLVTARKAEIERLQQEAQERKAAGEEDQDEEEEEEKSSSEEEGESS